MIAECAGLVRAKVARIESAVLKDMAPPRKTLNDMDTIAAEDRACARYRGEKTGVLVRKYETMFKTAFPVGSLVSSLDRRNDRRSISASRFVLGTQAHRSVIVESYRSFANLWVSLRLSLIHISEPTRPY